MPYVVTDACTQCGACVAGCENDAITEGETQSHIDVTICVECGTCMRNCPFDAIVYQTEAEGLTSPASKDTGGTEPSLGRGQPRMGETTL